jgi:hypothetical protein
MYLVGSGFLSGLDIKINKYETVTNLGMKWFKCADGNWYASDRGYQSDVYEAKFTIYGEETYINNILEGFNDNRTPPIGYGNIKDYVVTISGSVGYDEDNYFGQDVPMTIQQSGHIINIGERKQNSWKGFSTDFTIRCLSPTFSGTPTLPNWSGTCVAIGYNNQQIYTENYYDTYYGAFSRFDHRDDNGIITFTLNLTDSELRNLRTWVRTNRDDTFTMSGLYGVDTIVPNLSYPQDMKILEVKEKQRFNIDRWLVDVKLATHIVN